ncbi:MULTISPECIES: DUF3040 domain-containing protein [unclassified Pseudoclavibacter]|uniref:DUF3040 domain-containing protein n=1 Tax=unclassified Pseudoclavibacter TaxID=2615177 RepID=UPI001300E454|nr:MULTISPECIES: DUF3040 domain-containing protein [unclassified Pseudoclavibacter]KAB1646465.1 DUF3040 domain-containing protein [Pseudoclavibacter sp. CFCC 14310]KAB1663375.1 DUF3040 domain-containing protein [Pseudoclavibacter sp. CFCC 13611]
MKTAMQSPSERTEVLMPLSDHEQKLLEEMERNLYQAESDEVSTDQVPRSLNRMAVVLGVIGVVIGLALLLWAVSAKLIVVGVVGFVLIVASIIWAMRPTPVAAGAASAGSDRHDGPNGSGQTKSAKGASMGQRMEDRWNRRFQ